MRVHTLPLVVAAFLFQPLACRGDSWVQYIADRLVFRTLSSALSDVLVDTWRTAAKEASQKREVRRVTMLYQSQAQQAGAPAGALRRVQQLAERLTRTNSPEESAAIEKNLNFIISFPWAERRAPVVDCEVAKRLLATLLPNMQDVVDRFGDYCATLQDLLHQRARIPVLCIVGPKSISKFWIAKTMALALRRSSVVIGGVLPEASQDFLVGEGDPLAPLQNWHPGFFTDFLAKYGDGTPVVIFENIDHIAELPATYLASLFATAEAPVDTYLGCAPSYANFACITTATEVADIAPELRSKMDFVYLTDYSPEAKAVLAKTVLCEMEARLLGIPSERCVLAPTVLMKIVTTYANEPGTNALTKALHTIFVKAKQTFTETGSWPELTIERVDAYLAGAALLSDGAHPESFQVPMGSKISGVDLDEFKLPYDARREAEEDLEQIKTSVAGQAVADSRQHLRWLLTIPWQHRDNKKTLDLAAARRILDEDHYGLREVKERILDHLAVCATSGSRSGTVLCLAGPPGVGKTSIARSIARCLGRSFARAALGGVWGESAIRGWERSYVSAAPGKIIKAFRETGVTDPVILLDEIDKLGGSSFHGDPASALLEVLDPEQNKQFIDAYLGVPYDLSHAFFIVAVNNISEVPKPLRDRLEIISLPGYVSEEKMAIAKSHLLPRVRNLVGLADDWAVPDALIAVIIEQYTREAGVRDLERQLKRVAEKQLRVRLETGTAPVLTPALLQEFLGAPLPEGPDRAQFSSSGIALGLAWNGVGGNVVRIETAVLPGKGHMVFTGLLGDVMKESAQIAISYVRAHAAEIGVGDKDCSSFDLHVHVPEGASRKDGPSAGIALAVSLVSAVTGKVCKPDVAMTGEIDLHGNVWPVGGLREKLTAARRGNVKTVFVPVGNRASVEEIDPNLLGDLKVVFVAHIREVIEAVFALG